jgi:hypothetical protein
MNWEGEAPAEPKRQRMANSEQQIANGEWFFWRAVFLHCRKIFGSKELRSAPRTQIGLTGKFALPDAELVRCEQGHNFAAFEFNRCRLASRQLLLRFPEKVGEPH